MTGDLKIIGTDDVIWKWNFDTIWYFLIQFDNITETFLQLYLFAITCTIIPDPSVWSIFRKCTLRLTSIWFHSNGNSDQVCCRGNHCGVMRQLLYTSHFNARILLSRSLPPLPWQQTPSQKDERLLTTSKILTRRNGSWAHVN